MRSGTENQVTLYLIRHGETPGNLEHRYIGRTDEPLSEEGRKTLTANKKAAGDSLSGGNCQTKYPCVDILFSSPMKRCLETAEILYPGRESILIEEWKEIDFGVFEGKNYEELKDDERYQAWVDSNGMLPFPEGESRESFVLRCEKGFEKMAQMIWERKKGEEEGPETVGMVVHGGTIMAVLSRYYGGEYFDYQIPNGEGYKCRLTESSGKLQIEKPEKIWQGEKK